MQAGNPPAYLLGKESEILDHFVNTTTKTRADFPLLLGQLTPTEPAAIRNGARKLPGSAEKREKEYLPDLGWSI